MCPNKTGFKPDDFNMITTINELKTLIMHTSCKRKYRFDRKKM